MSIPLSQIIQINPGVVSTGSNPLALNGLILTTNASAPVGTVQTCYSLDEVATFYGNTSEEYKAAAAYFTASNVRQALFPDALFFTRYGVDATGAWARGASLAGTQISDIQEITGSLSVTIDGTLHSTETLSLSAVTSFSDAAQAIQTALSLESGQSVIWNAENSRFEIYSGTTGAGSAISDISGTAAGDLGLSDAVLSQGSDAVSETDAVSSAAKANLNWACFTVLASGDSINATVLQNLAKWQAEQNHRYAFVAWDNNTDALSDNASGTFGQWVQQNKYNVLVCYNNPLIACFVMGVAASINWNAVNGRTAFAFKSQEGLEPTVFSLAEANNLLANGYSYYGGYAADGPGNTYNFFYDGKLAGDWGWFDTYINQIFLNSQLRIAMIDLLRGVNTLPYNDFGKTQIRAAAMAPIEQGLLNGTIRAGVTLSDSQKIQVQAMVGFDVSQELYTKGYYLMIDDASAQTRGERKSPPIYFFYCDGGSIQRIVIPSIVIQ